MLPLEFRYRIADGKYLFWDCAVKFFGIEDLSGSEQLEYLARLDPDYRRGGK